MADACLLRAGEDYHQCNAQVENYKTCKRFWVNLCIEMNEQIERKQDNLRSRMQYACSQRLIT